MKLITLAELIEAIRRVAASEPDFVYNGGGSCTYLPNKVNHCGCIVGEALILLGIEPEILDDLDQLRLDTGSSNWGHPAVGDQLVERLTAAALDSQWVIQVQELQDSNYTWGEAVAGADEDAVRLGWVLA